ncbi:unnamed protein product [Rhizophagus irregularis]|nr:unnamed protein product [Rhizophagus irregularis]CAB5342722.1 unnamed protein product [Rhizophagus irregularis]
MQQKKNKKHFIVKHMILIFLIILKILIIQTIRRLIKTSKINSIFKGDNIQNDHKKETMQQMKGSVNEISD